MLTSIINHKKGVMSKVAPEFARDSSSQQYVAIFEIHNCNTTHSEQACIILDHTFFIKRTLAKHYLVYSRKGLFPAPPTRIWSYSVCHMSS